MPCRQKWHAHLRAWQKTLLLDPAHSTCCLQERCLGSPRLCIEGARAECPAHHQRTVTWARNQLVLCKAIEVWGGCWSSEPNPPTTAMLFNSCDLHIHIKTHDGTSLVAQWLGVRLPMQGTRVRALVQEDPTWRGATGPVSRNRWAHVPRLLRAACLEPVLHRGEVTTVRGPGTPARSGPRSPQLERARA